MLIFHFDHQLTNIILEKHFDNQNLKHKHHLCLIFLYTMQHESMNEKNMKKIVTLRQSRDVAEH